MGGRRGAITAFLVLAAAACASPPGARAWEAEQLTFLAPDRVAVALAPDGDAISLSQEGFLRRRPRGGPWGPVRRIRPVVLPRAALRADGAAVVAFLDDRDRPVVAEMGPDDTVRWAEVLSNEAADLPEQIVLGPDGAVHVVRPYPPASVRTRPPGGRFGPAVILSDAKISWDEVETGLDARGTLTVAWVSEQVLHAATRSPSGVWDRQVVARQVLGDRQAVDLSVSPDGGAVLGWTGHDEQPEDPVGFGFPRIALRAPSGSGFVRAPGPGGEETATPHDTAVSRSPTGRVTAIWTSRPNVYLTERSPDGVWSPTRLVAGRLHQPVAPRIVEGRRGGRRVLLWTELNGVHPDNPPQTAAVHEVDGRFGERRIVAENADDHVVAPVEASADGSVAVLTWLWPRSECLGISIDHPEAPSPHEPVTPRTCHLPYAPREPVPPAAEPGPPAVRIVVPRERRLTRRGVPVAVLCPSTCSVTAVGRLRGRSTGPVRGRHRGPRGGRVRLRLKVRRSVLAGPAGRQGRRLAVQVRIRTQGRVVRRRAGVRLR